MGNIPDNQKDTSSVFFERTWILVAGLALGALTLIFLMVLVVMSVYGNPPPESVKYIVITIISFGLAFSTAFLGGRAAIKGSIPFLPEDKTAGFSMVGGVAVFLIVFIVASMYYPSNSDKTWNGYLSSLNQGVAKIYNVDDAMIVKVNGEALPEVKYGSSNSFDIKDKLKVGENVLSVEILNSAYGGCSGALQLVFNDHEQKKYEYSWKNDFAPVNSVCYSELIKFKIK
jgi:hypothetical protein